MNSLFFKRIKTNALTRGFIAMRTLGRTPPPKTVIWECTLDCTMACIHCGSGGKRTGDKELSTEEICGIIHDLS
jgi:MoaA/NifB/PqqE/SkfB family radical SAM enzyme